jgi:hypothetical protein
MTVSRCPDHGDLMLELALGRLDDGEAGRAEGLRTSCAGCRQLWSSSFDESALAVVDAAVAEAFAGFRAPRYRRRGWWAAAAAAVLVLGIGATSLLWRGGEDSAAAPRQPVAFGAVLSVWDFENGSLAAEASPAVVEARAQSAAEGEGAVFTNDLESGDLASWSFHS